MRYHNITTLDMLNGTGLRSVLWLSHCDHMCPNCHNKITWSKDSGLPFDDEARQELLYSLEPDYVQGITFSGGDALSTINRDEVGELAKEIKELFPNKNIWCYTGYEWEEIKHLPYIKYFDVIVDGKFKEELSVPSPKYCGSSNQRIIDVQKSLQQGEVVLCDV